MAKSTSLPSSYIAMSSIPPLVALRPYYLETSYVSYNDDETAVIAEGVFSPRVKVAIETANIDEPYMNLVNLRCCYSNKYIGRSDQGSVIPIAHLTQPDEDLTSSTCTLFDLQNVKGTPYTYSFRHYTSNTFLMINASHDTLELSLGSDEATVYFQLVDWQSLVNLPPRVAFKGSNGSYLKGCSVDGLRLLQFSGGDPNNQESMHEVEMQSDGYVKIKCLLFAGNYWRYGSSWIRADTQDATDKSFIFWPVKLDDTTIALRNAYNNNFCVNISSGDAVNCLDADSPTITTNSHLVVQELVSGRNISDVVYRMDHARITSARPYTAGSTTVENKTDEEASVNVSLTYTYSTSYTFSNSSSLTAGVSVSIEATLLEIVKETIEASVEVSTSLEWGKTTTIDKSITAQGTVTVPANTSATIYYVGTVGNCNVPFSYKQQDQSSTDGSYSYVGKDDGIYTGVNAYDFSFTFENPAAKTL